MAKAEGEVTDEDEADEIECYARKDGFSPEFEDELFVQQYFNARKHLLLGGIGREHPIKPIGAEDEISY